MTRYSKYISPPQQGADLGPNEYTYVEGYGFTPQPPIVTERRLLQWYSNGIGFAILLYLILIRVVPFLVISGLAVFQPAIRIYGNQVFASELVFYLTNLISNTVCMLLPFLMFVLLCRIPMRIAFPLRRTDSSLAAFGVAIALGVSVIGGFASSLIQMLLGALGLQAQLSSGLSMPTHFSSFLVYMLYVVLLSPLVEEVIFRGIILNSMRRFGDSFALLVSALLFALFHGNLIQAPNAFLMGLVIGYFVLCTGSLWTGIVIHMINNSLILLWQALSLTIPDQWYAFFQLVIIALYLMAGIVAFLTLVRVRPNMFMFIRSSTYSTEQIKYRTFFSSVTLVVALTLLGLGILQNLTGR